MSSEAPPVQDYGALVALITELQKTIATLTKKLEAYENQARSRSRNENGGSEQAEKNIWKNRKQQKLSITKLTTKC